MTWTATPPTSPGWYWVRHEKMPPTIALVSLTIDGSDLFVSAREGPVFGPLRILTRQASNRHGLTLEWAGPIPEPKS